MGLAIAFDTAISALRASQFAVDTAADNMANVRTDGYSRRRALFAPVAPTAGRMTAFGDVTSQIGQGVQTTAVVRLRNEMLDIQYRDMSRLRDEYQQRADVLRLAELTINEPSDDGLQALISGFFNSVRDLTNQPESFATRAAAIEQGSTLAGAFRRTAGLLKKQQSDLDISLDLKLREINEKAIEISELNARIRVGAASGASVTFHEDRRDLLLDELAALAGATHVVQPTGMVDVMIGTRKLVDGISVDQLVGVPNPLNNNFRRVAFTSDNATATGLAGGAGAIVTARDSDIAGIIQSINDVASALITAVNAYHRTGYGLDGVTGRDFFAGADASTIDLNPQLVDHPERFAAANVANEPGNTEVARLIAGVQYERVLSGNTVTIDDAYRTAVARLGVAAQQANQRADNQDALTRNLSMARQSVAGINVDEEMLNLQKGQHAYQAAARVITTVDEMLDTLINRTFR